MYIYLRDVFFRLYEGNNQLMTQAGHMPLRLPADWMGPADDRLLELLEVEGPKTPTQISRDDRIDLSRQHINTRLRQLEDAEFVKNLGNGVYSVTDRGEQYLCGDFDARNLEEPDGG